MYAIRSYYDFGVEDRAVEDHKIHTLAAVDDIGARRGENRIVARLADHKVIEVAALKQVAGFGPDHREDPMRARGPWKGAQRAEFIAKQVSP